MSNAVRNLVQDARTAGFHLFGHTPHISFDLTRDDRVYAVFLTDQGRFNAAHQVGRDGVEFVADYRTLAVLRQEMGL